MMPGGVNALAPAISAAKAATVAGILLNIGIVSETRPRVLLWYRDGSIPTNFTTRKVYFTKEGTRVPHLRFGEAAF